MLQHQQEDSEETVPEAGGPATVPATALQQAGGGPATVFQQAGGGPATVSATVLQQAGGGPATVFQQAGGRPATFPATAFQQAGGGPATVPAALAVIDCALPLPKITKNKGKGRKRGTSVILTGSPMKNILTETPTKEDGGSAKRA